MCRSGRGGKSVLLEQIRDEIGSPNTIVLNFEDLGNQRIVFTDLRLEIDVGQKGHTAVLDILVEGQGRVSHLKLCKGKRVYNKGDIQPVKFHADIYITGSNSRLLSGELATYIAGRYISFVVYS